MATRNPVKTATLRAVWRLQDQLIHLLGNSAEGRTPQVAGMLHRDATEATSYWLQLVVSVGIATLGLVVGSTAVVIGAMLVAPLMGPIIGLAMGLATGSPFLVLRSAGRIALSVSVAVGGAAVITLLLPFHELNSEISARTSPTVLDLVTAGFCALAGVYASMRSGSDAAAAAAGTSISISLVPPLCASGYGLGTMAWPVAWGAALLFLTNLVAIVVVGTVAFVIAGFNRVDVLALEREELLKGQDAPIARAMARRLARMFESRVGPALRILMPFFFLGAVYVPLRHALDEVAWQVRVRAAVRSAIDAETLRVVESKVRVERHEVEIVVVLLGSTQDADGARARLEAAIRGAAGVVPRMEVFAVPDATAFAGLESTLLKPRAVETPTPPPPPPPDPSEQLDAGRAWVRATVLKMWPSASAGEPLVVEVGTDADQALSIRVVHVGPPLSPDGLETIQGALDAGLGRESSLIDVAVPSEELTRRGGDLSLVARVSSAVRASAAVPEIGVCVVRPEEPKRAKKPPPDDLALAAALDAILSKHPRVVTTTGGPWSVKFVEGSCASPPAPEAEEDPANGDATPGAL